MRGKRENFFSREKKFSLSPRAPLSLSRKAEKLFYLLLPTLVRNRAKEKDCFCRNNLHFEFNKSILTPQLALFTTTKQTDKGIR